MPTKLTNLRIDEVSSVDRGAGEGVKVVLMKRADSSDTRTDTAEKALRLAVASIGDDPDKLVECFKQFHSFLNGDQPEDIMVDKSELQSMIDAAVAKAIEETEKRKKPAKPENTNSVSGDHDKPDATGGADSAAGDTGKTDKNDDGDADDTARKVLEKLGIKLEKKADKPTDTEIAKRDAEIVDLKKHVQQLVEKQQIEEFAKRAEGIGLTRGDGEYLRKAYSGEVKSLDWLVEKVATLHTQVAKAGLFNTIGDDRGGSASAHDELLAKAAEIQKAASAAGKPITQAVAYVKAMDLNPEIAKREREEAHARIQKAAQ